MSASVKVVIFDAEGSVMTTDKAQIQRAEHAVDPMLKPGGTGLPEETIHASEADRIRLVMALGRQQMIPVLRNAADRYTTVLMVDTSKDVFEILNRFNRFDKAFDRVYVSGYSGFRAPEPEAYLQIPDDLKVEAGECVYLSFNRERVEGARRVGVLGMLLDDASGGFANLVNEAEKAGVRVAGRLPVHGGVIGGVYGIEMTSDVARKIGRAFGSVMGVGAKVAVARDGALQSRVMREPFVAGCLEVGCDVVDYGVVPSTILAYGTAMRESDGGVMIRYVQPRTAFTFSSARYPDRAKLEEEVLGRLGAPPTDRKGAFRVHGVTEDYAAFLAGFAALEMQIGQVPTLTGVRVSLAPGAPEPMPYLLRRAGLNLTDEDYSMRISIGKKGDTAVFSDEKGRQVDGYTVFALLAMHGKAKGRMVVCDYGCPAHVRKLLEDRGVVLMLAPPDSDGMRNAIARNMAVVGYDGGGGYAFGETFGVSSPVFATVRLAMAIADAGTPLSEMAAGVQPTFVRREEGACDAEVGDAILSRLGSIPGAVKNGGYLTCGEDGCSLLVYRDAFTDRIVVRIACISEPKETMNRAILKVWEAIEASAGEIPGVIRRVQAPIGGRVLDASKRTDARLVRLIMELGPDIKEIASRMGVPEGVVWNRYKERLLGQGFVVQALPNQERMGLIRMAGIVDLAPAYAAHDRELFIALSDLAFLTHYAKVTPGGSYEINLSVPEELVDDVKGFLNGMLEGGVFTRMDIHGFDWFRVAPMAAEAYDFDAGKWNFGWERDARIVGSGPVKPEGRASFDYTDLLVAKELQMNASRSLEQIAQKLGIGYQEVAWHYNLHVLEGGLIKGYRVNWMRTGLNVGVDEKGRLLKTEYEYIPTGVLVTGTVEEEVGALTRKFNGLPFLWAEMGGGDYFAEFMFPPDQMQRALKYIENATAGMQKRTTVVIFDPANAVTFTFPYQFYDRANRRWAFDRSAAKTKLENLLHRFAAADAALHPAQQTA